jgi:hypothetical protein
VASDLAQAEEGESRALNSSEERILPLRTRLYQQAEELSTKHMVLREKHQNSGNMAEGRALRLGAEEARGEQLMKGLKLLTAPSTLAE